MYLEIQIIAVFDIALLKMYQEINVLKIISYSTKKSILNLFEFSPSIYFNNPI